MRAISLLGASASGKSTMLRVLSDSYPSELRVVATPGWPRYSSFKSDPAANAAVNQLEALGANARTLRRAAALAPAITDASVDRVRLFTSALAKENLLSGARLSAVQRATALAVSRAPHNVVTVCLRCDERTRQARLSQRQRADDQYPIFRRLDAAFVEELEAALAARQARGQECVILDTSSTSPSMSAERLVKLLAGAGIERPS